MRILVSLLFTALLSGCGLVYKIDIQQGNYVTQDLVAKLKPGMTKAEVRALLGTPLLSDVFHNNRWDYYFSNVKGGKAEDRTRLSVFFDEDKLVSVRGDARPAQAQADPANSTKSPPKPAPPSASVPAATPPIPPQPPAATAPGPMPR
jgi:outer membrane protein assembly factor BamE